MSVNLSVNTNKQIQQIGHFNHLKVVHLPQGVSVNVAFSNTPDDEDMFPLTDIVKDVDSNENLVDFARECFLHITGTSTEDIKIIASNSKDDDGFVIVEPLASVSLETTTKDAIETNTFKPSSTGIEQVTIIAGASHTVTKGTLKAIRFHASDEVGLSLDADLIKYPIFEDILYLDNINTDVTFHNDNALSIKLTVWKM